MDNTAPAIEALAAAPVVAPTPVDETPVAVEQASSEIATNGADSLKRKAEDEPVVPAVEEDKEVPAVEEKVDEPEVVVRFGSMQSLLTELANSLLLPAEELGWR